MKIAAQPGIRPAPEFDSTSIIELAERAERCFELHGRSAARSLVVPAMPLEAVIAALKSDSEIVRRKSLSLLHCWEASLAAPQFVDVLLHDACPVVRHEAAYYLATLKRPETIQPLIAALLEDVADLVRHEAAEALGDMGAITAIPALRLALLDSSEVVARTARISIEQLSKPTTAR